MPRPLPNNPNVAKAIMTFASDTRVFQNILHFSATSAWTSLQLAQLATDLISWWNLAYKARMSNEVALTLVQTRKLDPDDPLGVDQPVIPPSPGTAANTSTPSNATVTMSWRTGLAGRRYRGRNYVPGLCEVDVTVDDRINSTLIASLQAAATSLIASTLSHGALTIFHAPNETPNPLDNTFTNVTTAVIENIIDSQRRRLPGRGR